MIIFVFMFTAINHVNSWFHCAYTTSCYHAWIQAKYSQRPFRCHRHCGWLYISYLFRPRVGMQSNAGNKCPLWTWHQIGLFKRSLVVAGLAVVCAPQLQHDDTPLRHYHHHNHHHHLYLHHHYRSVIFPPTERSCYYRRHKTRNYYCCAASGARAFARRRRRRRRP